MTDSVSFDPAVIASYLSRKPMGLGRWNVLNTIPASYRKRKVISAIEGLITVGESNVLVRVAFTKAFPFALPIIFLTPADALGFIPHLEEDGYVCYTDGDGQYLNFRQPETVVEEALRRAIETLANGYQGKNQVDFINGFAEYWGKQRNTTKVGSLVKPDVLAKEIIFSTVAKSTKGVGHNAFFADNQSSIRSLSQELRASKLIDTNALFVPLLANSQLLPPPFSKFWTFEFVRNIVQRYTSVDAQKEFRRLLGTSFRKTELVLFGLPRPKGGFSIFGICFSGVKNAHPLLPGSIVSGLQPISITRLDRDYLFPRGGSNPALENKRVGIIGCGSLGSHTAVELARAGVGQLTLIDSDVLTYDNVLRHAVGPSGVGLYKVHALKNEIERSVPFCSITTETKRIEELTQRNDFHLQSFDLLIVATGEPTVNLYLNDLLSKTNQPPASLFTWLDPYGIGGHSLIRQNYDSPGCLECLYELSGGELLNRASFASPNQNFLKDLSGCGSLFTPYGSLDSNRTAEQTVRLSILSLSGNCGNLLQSWKGNDASFCSEGFHKSARYNLHDDGLRCEGSLFARSDCPVCASDENIPNFHPLTDARNDI